VRQAARTAIGIVAVAAIGGASAQGQNAPGPAVPQPPAVVSGVFVDADGVAIRHAVLSVVGESLRVAADSQGRFSLPVPPGPRLLAARALGYRPLMWSIKLEPGQQVTLRVRLQELSVVLPGITVTAQAYLPSRLEGFYQRRRTGFGTFLDSTDLARRFTNSTPDLLQGIPGVHMRRTDPFTVLITFARCQAVDRSLGVGAPSNILGPDHVQGSAPPTVKSTVGVYVDGFRVGGTASEALANINPADIEAIEVYRGPSELPAEFMSDDCAAIVIWTRY